MAGQLRGSVKSWNPEKGWGFIDCAQTHAMYGKDIFLRRMALLGGIEVVNKGDQVQFTVTDNGKGPEAQACQCINVSGWGVPTPPPPQAQAGLAGSMIGTVKSWNPVKGWGHITSDQITKMFQKDVFVMKSQVLGGHLEKGQSVRFTVQTGQKGIEASSVQVLSAQQANGYGYGYSQQAQAQQWPAKVGYGATANGGGKQQQFFGTVKNYQAEKGWGHIDCQQTRATYNKDMFFLKSSLGGAAAEQNDYVTFSVQQGAKGPEAINVKVISGDVGGVNAGTVKQWVPDKNYGFIACDTTRQIYQRDIFLHGKELNGYKPTVGEEVQFTVEIAGDGRPEAVGVSFAGGGAGTMGYAQQTRAAPY